MRTGFIAAAAFVASIFGFQAHAQDSYPSKTVRIIVPTSPGSGQDAAARIMADVFSKKFGKPFVVDNVPGGATTIGAAQASKATPDGYTLLIGTISSVGLGPLFQPTLGYKPTDFAPISQLNRSTGALIVNAEKIPAKSLQELVALMKQNPDKYTYASVGVGTILQMEMVLFNHVTGTSLVHVPYKGGAEVLESVVGGHTDMAFNSLTSALAQIKTGRVRALAVSLPERDETLADVPTVREIYPDMPDISLWAGLFAPAGTPQPIIDKLSKAAAEFLQTDEGRAAMKKAGDAKAVGSTPEEFSKAFANEVKTWQELIKSANIKIE